MPRPSPSIGTTLWSRMDSGQMPAATDAAPSAMDMANAPAPTGTAAATAVPNASSSRIAANRLMSWA